MTRWIRFLLALLHATSRRRFSALDEESVLFCHTWPTDADLSVVNHAAVVSLMELGRIDLMVRSGFIWHAIRNGWTVPVGAIAVRFERPARPLQALTLSTRLVYADEQWLYVRHRLTRGEKTVASAVVQATVRRGRERISHQHVLDTIGLPYHWEGSPPELGSPPEVLETGRP